MGMSSPTHVLPFEQPDCHSTRAELPVYFTEKFLVAYIFASLIFLSGQIRQIRVH